jgi:hypothetical protein
MEDILTLNTQPEDPLHPLVCMDEVPKQLLSDVREPIPGKPGQPERFDYEYQRNGVANLFMFFEPFNGQRHVKVTDTRNRIDWAEAMRELSDVIHPEAEKIIVVLDNLNIHTPATFYLAFPPYEASRLVNRFEFTNFSPPDRQMNMIDSEESLPIRRTFTALRLFSSRAVYSVEVDKFYHKSILFLSRWFFVLKNIQILEFRVCQPSQKNSSKWYSF